MFCSQSFGPPNAPPPLETLDKKRHEYRVGGLIEAPRVRDWWSTEGKPSQMRNITVMRRPNGRSKVVVAYGRRRMLRRY